MGDFDFNLCDLLLEIRFIVLYNGVYNMIWDSGFIWGKVCILICIGYFFYCFEEFFCDS